MSAHDALGLGRLLPGPGWLVIDAARELRFTGEVVLLADEAVRVYFDRGRVYLAERASDPPLGTRLVESGALSEQQLEYGRLRVRDTDHLGRLFERVPNVSRDSVITVTDVMNEQTLAWLAGQLVQSVGVAPYRHHSSGLHHWLDSTATSLAAAWPAPTLTVPAPPPSDPIDTAPTGTPGTETPPPAAPSSAPPVDSASHTPAGSGTGEETSRGSRTSVATVDEIVTWDVPDPFDTTGWFAPRRENRHTPEHVGDVAGRADAPASEFFGVIWPTGEVDDLADMERSVDRREPPVDPTIAPAVADRPATPEHVGQPADDADTLAVRRAIATIDTGSLAARRRLVESTQPAAPPVITERDADPVLDDPDDEAATDGGSATDDNDNDTGTQHHERVQALRRMINGLRRD